MPITIPTCSTDTEVISSLGDLPNVDDNLTADELKAKFDSAGTGLKGFLNNTLKPILSNLVTLIEGHVAETGNVHNATAAQIIGTGDIKTSMLDDGSVTAAKIAENAVTAEKLADGSVGSRAIVQNGVQTVAIKDGAVTEAKIADAAASKWNGKQDALAANQKRHIFVQSTQPTMADGDIWIQI